MLKKLVIASRNLPVCFLTIEVSYTKLLIITQLIFIVIEFEVLKKVSCNYNSLTKLKK